MSLDHFIDGEKVCEAAEDFAKRAKKKGLKVGIGGGVSLDSIPVLTGLKEYLDKFETRKIVFSIDQAEETLKKGLVLAMEFEMLYLQNKCRFYGEMEQEDAQRVEMLKKRHAAALERVNS